MFTSLLFPKIPNKCKTKKYMMEEKNEYELCIALYLQNFTCQSNDGILVVNIRGVIMCPASINDSVR